MSTATKITSKWTTLAIVGHRDVCPRFQNPAAHGGVCLLQVRRGTNGNLGRKVNSNGRHQEIGETFALDADTLAHWEAIAKDAR